MATNGRNRYNSGSDDYTARPANRRTQRNPQNTKAPDAAPTFDTEVVSRVLEEQANSHVRKASRETTYSTGPLPTDQVAPPRRNRPSSGQVRSPRAEEEERIRKEDMERERIRKERRRQRREALKWRRAHWIVRMLIVLFLVLDLLILRFGVFSGGFLPVWNVLTARKASGTQTEQPAEFSGPAVSEQLLTVNDYSRPGTELEAINGIVIHYIGNPGTDAQENRDYFERLKDGTDEVYASSNYIIGLDGTIIQCVPDNEVAYASGDRNKDTISIECCHPDDSGAFTQETFNSLVQLTAKLCKQYNLTTDQLLRHYDVNQNPCPKFFVDDPDAWNNFLASVQAYL